MRKDGVSRTLVPVAIFALVDAIALAIVVGIPNSEIGWSWTGFHHGGGTHFGWGYDAVWFPLFLATTGYVFFMAGKWAQLLGRRSLVVCVLVFSIVRLVAAYTLWCSFEIVKPLLLALGVRRWPPWGPPGVLGVLVLEVAIVALVTLVFVRRESRSVQTGIAR